MYFSERFFMKYSVGLLLFALAANANLHASDSLRTTKKRSAKQAVTKQRASIRQRRLPTRYHDEFALRNIEEKSIKVLDAKDNSILSTAMNNSLAASVGSKRMRKEPNRFMNEFSGNIKKKYREKVPAERAEALRQPTGHLIRSSFGRIYTLQDDSNESQENNSAMEEWDNEVYRGLDLNENLDLDRRDDLLPPPPGSLKDDNEIRFQFEISDSAESEEGWGKTIGQSPDLHRDLSPSDFRKSPRRPSSPRDLSIEIEDSSIEIEIER
jgi:hypothetical protein